MILSLEILTQSLIFVNKNISLRIELFLKALTTNPFSQIWFTLRIQSFWTFFNMTHRIGSKIEHFFSTWLKRKCLFFSLTRRIFLFDTMYDSKNKLIVFGKYDSKNWTFFQFDSKNWTLFLECDSKNWTFFSKWLKEFFFSIWLEDLNPLFWICLNELNPFVDWLRELNPVFFFFQYDSKTWPSSKIWLSRIEPFENMNQRIELLKVWLEALNPLFQYESKKWFFWTWLTKLKELKLLLTNDSKSWTFLKKKHDSQNWTIFSCDSRNWTLLSNMSHRNWTFLFFMTQRIEPFLNMTRRMNLFSWIWRKDWSFSLKFWQRIEPSFSKMAQRIELSFRVVSQRVKLFFLEKWLEEMIFSIWLKELNFLFDSKNWTSFSNYDSQM